MKINEQRQAQRYKVKMPVDFESGKGITRDFSASGIFFETDKSFSVGQNIEFSILMDHIDSTGPVQVKCLGKIVRIEKSGKMIGIAAAINSYAFESAQNVV
jgi:hypothetical protein